MDIHHQQNYEKMYNFFLGKIVQCMEVNQNIFEKSVDYTFLFFHPKFCYDKQEQMCNQEQRM